VQLLSADVYPVRRPKNETVMPLSSSRATGLFSALG
jgi:hypothetical protein